MEHLIRAVKEKRFILFVGGGVSMNLGLPEWKELISHLADELNYPREKFHSYGDYLSLAEYYQEKHGSLDPLIQWMDTSWHCPAIDVGSCDIHRLIVELDPPIIYTTNYDRWIERAFDHYGKPYTRIVNVADLINIREGVPQIVKFHGDFDDPASIVLTESSYFNRLDFEGPLDIKLRSDMLSRTILFIGYRLSDINIRYLIYKLQRLWDGSVCSTSRPQSYIFLAQKNPVQEAVLRKRGIATLFSKRDLPGEGLREFLETLAEKAAK